MAKSNINNPTKILFPTLAVAVLGMAVMVGVTSNLQRNFNPDSQAGNKKCESISHPLDKDFVGRHFYSKAGAGTVSGKQDGDRMEIEQPDTTSSASTRVTYDKKGIGDFATSITIKDLDLKPKKDAGDAYLGAVNGSSGGYMGVRSYGDGKSRIYAQEGVDGEWDTKWTDATQLKLPVTLIMERKAGKMLFSYKIENGKKQLLKEVSSPTTEPLDLRLGSGSRGSEFPGVTVAFSDFVINCN